MAGGRTARDVEIAIIGGGIIGVAAASFLAEIGQDVLVVDRSGICEETSAGNAGALAFSDILPLAHKGMLSKLPGWLTDPLGPLAIPPAYLPRLLPWLMRFLEAGKPENLRPAVAAQAAMMALAEEEWKELTRRTGLGSMLHEGGCLELYESDAEFRAASRAWSLQRQHRIDYQHVGRQGIAELQPGLSGRFVRGTFVPGWKTVSDPQLFGQAIWAHAELYGARFRPGTVAAARRQGEDIVLRFEDGRALRCGTVIVAAGAWSRRLAASFGDPVPLETERGYNTTLPTTAFDVRRHLVFPRHGFVVAPLESGLRIGGAVEFGGLRRPPNFARARAMVKKATRFLPGLVADGGRQWMGFRPSLPDSLPVIGPSRLEPRAFYAFGHGHLGLTQATATARLVCQLVLGQRPSIDLAPFSAARFRKASR